MGCFVGIDVGKSRHAYAVVDAAGAELASGEVLARLRVSRS